ncbi:MAG: hypothetical protein ACLQGP_06825 [Isosphaeraceae bacterium]
MPITAFARELDKNPATIYRWINLGILRDASDSRKGRVRLESFKIGAVAYTTREAFARFLRRTNPATSTPAPEPTRTAAPRRTRELAAVDAELAKAGI